MNNKERTPEEETKMVRSYVFSTVMGGIGCGLGLLIGVGLIALLAFGGFAMLLAAPPMELLDTAMNGFMITSILLLILPPLLLGGLAFGLTRFVTSGK